MRKILLSVALLLAACAAEERSEDGAGVWGSPGGGAGETEQGGCEAVWSCLLHDCVDLWKTAEYPECRANCAGESDSQSETADAIRAFENCLHFGECGGC